MNKINKKNKLLQDFLTFHNFTQEEFCRIANITSHTLKKFINSEHYISLYDLKNIAHILGVDVTEIL